MWIVTSKSKIKFSKYSALSYRRHHSTCLRINLFAVVDTSELNTWILDVSLYTSTYKINSGIVRLKRDGPCLREEAGFKGKQANGVGTQLMKRKREVTACTALLPCYYYDVYTSPASAWLTWHPRQFEWTGPFLWKTKSSLRKCHHVSIHPYIG
jgi:hypothetical protein